VKPINELIPLSDLRFDPQNPRIPSGSYDVNNLSQVLEYMAVEGGIIDLINSIGQTGFSSAEPLLVVPNQSDNTYTVVEGNRRLAALILLKDPKLAPKRQKAISDAVKNAVWKPLKDEKIPTLVYKKRDDILKYLGYRHITGVKDWGPLEKARYLNQLIPLFKEQGVNDEKLLASLANTIGSRADYVGALLTSLNLYEYANEKDFFDLDITADAFHFSLLSTAVSYKNISSYIGLKSPTEFSLDGLDEEKFQNILKWLFDSKEKKISESRDLKLLAAVVASAEAEQKLVNRCSLEEAVIYTSQPRETFLTLLGEAKEKLSAAHLLSLKLPDLPDGSIEILQDIETQAMRMKKSLPAAYSKDS
jgi:hypothetical protein